ncbi:MULTISPECIES: precorrin-3B C(17)-methyltransferase [unclassified Fusibacter]|uniref:precorrin-3B C(17)-methyltransferase n=1 Tax=unclassified Fusibacter TaxID=2624464 RepID=UPI0010130218|nr:MULTISPECIES: precorrin-3B C(17)-methyltransferase [unclassified Fusibacter]MCK8060512.1 precorrin-3B C(17)-methyltransferase [Fusibacter sp. A2]NPE20199.1 precorrin-3B C(17)-methyltransferase [Fusibacter sp. A1]RXV63409.1 precorrin-3B C(17)-methyltransferase [Fusibacter sp. A1]
MIHVVGIGPGKLEAITAEALTAIEKCDVIVGYKTYIDLIANIIGQKQIVQNGMKKEVERCRMAVELAATGKSVAVISSGDAGVYGMAGLVLELCVDTDIEVNIIPGVTASSAAAALAGAPLMHDYCHISLSDLLTPLELIRKRIRYATLGEFVMCFYNPRSKGRPNHLKDAFDIIREHSGTDLAVVIVKDAYREGQEVIRTTLDTVDYEVVDMTSMVIVGNPATIHVGGKTITPRGYHL